MKKTNSQRKARVIIIGLHSDIFPEIGESHGISVLGGCLESTLDINVESLQIVDMVVLNNDKITSIIEIVRDVQPTIIIISVLYGRYGILKNMYPKIKKILPPDHLVIFGGPIPTYNPKIILQEIDSSSIVIQGEGDEAIIKIIQRWMNNNSFGDVANICYLEKKQIKCTKRYLVDISRTPPPYRKHMGSLISKGAQIYVENSRGCSWAACTFCMRGLTDIEGNCREYRTFPFQRLAKDLLTLRDNNVQVVTFADEDFLGGSIHECENFVYNLEKFVQIENMHICFDVSMNVCSIFSSRWTDAEEKRRKTLIDKLKRVGLRKVFVGVESGSSTQLVRYCKEHTTYESNTAVQILRDLGIIIEIGFIMFDPLCNLHEIEENIYYLQKNNLTSNVSSVASELRLQPNSRYLALLEKEEQKIGAKLFERILNPNTFTYPTNYADSNVKIIVFTVRKWNSYLRPLYYPLKNLSRYGKGGILGDMCTPVRNLLIEFRFNYLSRLLEAVTSVKTTGFVDEKINETFYCDLQVFCRKINEVFEFAPEFLIEHPIISSILSSSKKAVHDYND